MQAAVAPSSVLLARISMVIGALALITEIGVVALLLNKCFNDWAVGNLTLRAN